MTLRLFESLIMDSRVVDPTLDTEILVIMADPRPSKTLAEWAKASDFCLKGSGRHRFEPHLPESFIFSSKVSGQNPKFCTIACDFLLLAVKHDFLVTDPPEFPKKANYDKSGVILRPCPTHQTVVRP